MPADEDGNDGRGPYVDELDLQHTEGLLGAIAALKELRTLRRKGCTRADTGELKPLAVWYVDGTRPVPFLETGL